MKLGDADPTTMKGSGAPGHDDGSCRSISGMLRMVGTKRPSDGGGAPRRTQIFRLRRSAPLGAELPTSGSHSDPPLAQGVGEDYTHFGDTTTVIGNKGWSLSLNVPPPAPCCRSRGQPLETFPLWTPRQGLPPSTSTDPKWRVDNLVAGPTDKPVPNTQHRILELGYFFWP